MGRRTHRLAFFGAALFWLALAPGCQVRNVHVVVTDFDPKAVQGVEVYRVDQTTGAAVLAGTIQFENTQVLWDGTEALAYSVVAPTGEVTSGLSTTVERTGGVGSAELQLLFTAPMTSGYVRVASFNAAGASPLSQDQTYLM